MATKKQKPKFVATLHVTMMIEVPVKAEDLIGAVEGAKNAYQKVNITGGEILDISYQLQAVQHFNLWLTND